jgi:hypothetical protein
MTFFFSKLFFNPRGISVGALSESKILKMSGHARKPQKLGTLYREAGFLSDSVEGRRNFAHLTTHWRVKHRLGGRDMIPTCAWPILTLRGVSQPAPNAPEVPRTAGVCCQNVDRSQN